MNNKIIGGEFRIDSDIELNIRDDNNVNSVFFSSGRDALFEILLNIEEHLKTTSKVGIQIPDYLCTSVTSTIQDVSFNYKFYHISETTLLPDIKDIKEQIEDYPVVLLVNYFGVVNTDKEVDFLRKYDDRIILIVDNVQDFYEHGKNTTVDYSFTSYRKWFAVSDGADIISQNAITAHNTQTNNFAQYKFAGNILKNYSNYIDDGVALELLQKGEDILNKNYRCQCSELSRCLISRIDYDEIEKKRKRNAEYLHDNLSKMGIKHLYSDKAVPLFIPIFVSGRDDLRKKMFANNIFTPVHWSYVSEELNGEYNAIYSDELSLICDQRYDICDMDRIIGVLTNES